jgi:pentatricopeptide repeat protein
LKSGKVDKAWEVFDSMRLSYHQPDEVSYTLMLHACAKVILFFYEPKVILMDLCKER